MKRTMLMLTVLISTVISTAFTLPENRVRTMTDIYGDYIDVSHPYTLFLVNQETNETYSFDVGAGLIGQVPEGMYNVSIFETPPLSPVPPTMTFWTGNNTTTGPGGYFSGVYIDSSGNNTISIYP
jgi:hypothetical protein